ncbi:MAG: TonB-linked SusC/RagA family outer membrane protein [Neolewinella sp.]|jgi:TonB-linked SusC/RagA family outer membrane protein
MHFSFGKIGLLLIFCLFAHAALMAQYTVSGTVTDSNQETLIGVSILVKGTTSGTVTDFDGNFSVNIPAGAEQLLFSYTGFASQAVPVSGATSNLLIIMAEDVTSLDEIVVTGLASSIKRSNLANAVSTVSAEELTGATSQQTVDGALYGKMTGVNITQTSGAPGGGYAVRLRGVSSLSGNNQPLIIVDGVYISNVEIPSGSSNASGSNGGNEEGASNRLADINPDDIESMEVLKGASAAAIYGTRANAGVIIITTKKGTSGRTEINFSQDMGFNTIIKKVGRRSFTPQQVEDEFNAVERTRFEAAQAAGEIFDYEDEIYGEQGFISDSRLRISGGNEKTNFFLSGSYRDEAGIIKGTGYERLTTRLNISHKFNDRLKIQSNTNYVRSNSSRGFSGNENEGGLSYGYTLAFTRDWNNLFPDEDGVYPDNPSFAGNPLQTRDETRNTENIDRVLQGVNLQYSALQTDNQNLKFVLNGGVDFFLNQTEVYVPETFQSQRGLQNGFLGVGKNNVFNFNYSAIAVHDYYTDSGINFTTQAGITYLNFQNDFVYNQTTQLIPLQQNLTQGGAQSTIQSLSSVEEFGFLAQEEINYQDKIIGTVGIRFDKSSLNGDPNKYYAFPRASLAINLTEFDFWGNDFITQLKPRIAYGQTGNSASFGRLFTSLSPVSVGGQSGFSVTGAQGNSDLEPETSTELEFGIDIGLADNKVNIVASYYIRDVTNLLYDRSLPTSSGFGNEIRNDLDLRNTGFEFQLGLNPVRTPKFNYSTTLNFWFNNSEITRLGIPDGDTGEDIPSFVPPGVAFGLGLGSFYINEGSPITGLWNNGENGPEQTGDTEPDFQLGWSNNFTIAKNITISGLFHWRQGSDILNLTRLLSDIGGTTPRADDDLGSFIEDGSYFRLREASIYYDVPVKGDFIRGVKVGISGRNILTLTDYSSYDPEVSTKGGSGLSTNIEVTPFPSSKQFFFHLALNF